MLEIENSLIIFLQNNLPSSFIKLLGYTANFGDVIPVIVIAIIYWNIDRKFGLRLYMNISGANIFYPMLKNVVKRLRPYMVNKDIKCIQAAYDGDAYDVSVQGYSFPSGHAVNITTVYGPMIAKYKNIILRIILTTLIVLIGLSRFVLGVHYPSDVLVGFIFGLLFLLLLNYLLNNFDQKKVYTLIAIIGFIGFFFCESNDYYSGYGMFLGGLVVTYLEDRIKFDKATSFGEGILRSVVGLAIFYGLLVGMELPFSETFLESRTLAQYAYRTFRYAFIAFTILGLYPKAFNHFKSKKK